MKIAKQVFFVIILLSSISFLTGCGTYRTAYGKDSGVIKVGSYIWPAPQSEIIVFNDTRHFIDLKEGGSTEKVALRPTETFTFAYNVFPTEGMDVPLIAVLYDIVDGQKKIRGTLTRSFYLSNSSGGRFDRTQWVIKHRGAREDFYDYTE